jgi:mono/diheme cytochrome c family protein
MLGTGARPLALGAIALSLLAVLGCPAPVPPPIPPEQELIAKGRDLFFKETFDGNGRTCGTCHPAENNFALDASFIATLPPENPLFVAEFTPALRENFENPKLMRMFGLILENLDGFDDLPNKFTMRGVPHVLGLRASVNSSGGPRTGWSGDGAPGDGSIRSFATGAVIQHFTKTLSRIPGVDFRLPTDEELDALAAFQLSLGRQQDLALPLQLKGIVAQRGQQIFLDNALGKCNICHLNAGANAVIPPNVNPSNANFNTGVENLPDIPQKLTGERVPVDDGLGIPGDGTFNTPPLVEAADSGPFFHNNAVDTIEGAVAFYNGEAFRNSPSGQFLAGIDPNKVAIRLDATQVVAVAAFLRVINALENIRQAVELLRDRLASPPPRREDPQDLLTRARAETDDAIRVLTGGGLHPQAVLPLQTALRLIDRSITAYTSDSIQEAIRSLERAREDLVAP